MMQSFPFPETIVSFPAPALIVADEPVSMVDASLRLSIVTLLKNLRDAPTSVSRLLLKQTFSERRYRGCQFLVNFIQSF